MTKIVIIIILGLSGCTRGEVPPDRLENPEGKVHVFYYGASDGLVGELLLILPNGDFLYEWRRFDDAIAPNHRMIIDKYKNKVNLLVDIDMNEWPDRLEVKISESDDESITFVSEGESIDVNDIKEWYFGAGNISYHFATSDANFRVTDTMQASDLNPGIIKQ